MRDHHNELRVSVVETTAPARRFDVVFRVFNDGVGFRYEFPAQPGLGDFVITDELTEFTLADDAKAWWIPSNRSRLDRSEMLYSSSPVSVIDSVQTPLTMATRDGKTFIVIHEANLVDYARMYLAGPRWRTARCARRWRQWPDGVKVRGRTPFVTPWRTIQLADRAADLAPSVLGLNLNPPNVLGDVSWIKPMKYVGIWWGMHINTMTWSSGPEARRDDGEHQALHRLRRGERLRGRAGRRLERRAGTATGSRTATRSRSRRRIPTTTCRDSPRTRSSKGVKLIVHNETSGGIENYERQLDDAFALYHSLGLDAIKSGYVTDTDGRGLLALLAVHGATTIAR